MTTTIGLMTRVIVVHLTSWADSLPLTLFSTWSTEEMTEKGEIIKLSSKGTALSLLPAICCPTNARTWRRQKNSAPQVVAMETLGLILIVDQWRRHFSVTRSVKVSVLSNNLNEHWEVVTV